MQQKMLSSANNEISRNSDDDISDKYCNESEKERSCQCPMKKTQRTIRGATSTSAFIVYIYMWITIFSICCQGLPPVIKIGM